MTYQSPGTKSLQMKLARASRPGDKRAVDVPALRHRFAVSSLTDRIRSVISGYAPVDGLTENDRRALRDAFHKALDDVPVK